MEQQTSEGEGEGEGEGSLPSAVATGGLETSLFMVHPKLMTREWRLRTITFFRF